MSLEHGELPPAAQRRTRALAWLVFGLALGLWAWNAARERFLCDDAFISFRYAEHLARGLGLVWNPGERVEGYTNFLWVLAMAAGLRLGVAPELASQVLGFACGLGLLAVTFLAGPRGARERLQGALVALALAAHGSFGAWTTSGLETMGFAAAVWLATVRFLAEERDARRSRAGSAALFALATLTRPDGALFAAVAGAFLALAALQRRVGARAFWTFALTYALPVGAHALWRIAYYGDWLPNTFRAKVPGTRLDQGFAYLWLYQRHYHALFFAPIALLALVGRRRSAARLLLATLALQLVYVALVGGDRFEFRFLVAVLPHYAWLVVEGLFALPGSIGTPATARARTIFASLAGAAFLATTHLGYDSVTSDLHRIAPIRAIRGYAERRAYEGRFLRERIERGVLPRDLVLCVGGAGAVPYYTRWTTVDRRGLNDRWIASQRAERRGVIAHERDAPSEYLVERRVVVFDFLNRLVVPPEAFARMKPRHEHDGRALTRRAIRLDDAYFVFATFVSEEELATTFPGHELLRPPSEAATEDGTGSAQGDAPEDTEENQEEGY